MLAGILEASGHRVVTGAEEAEVILVNTCSFIEPAVAESLEVVLSAVEEKKAGRAEAVIVAGCLPQRYRRDGLPSEMPEVDAWLGPGELESVGRIVAGLGGGTGSSFSVGAKPVYLYDHGTPRRRLGSSHVVYVKVSEGCHHRCSYCLIPDIRGPVRSREFESITAEVAAMAADGPTPEVVLVGQDTMSYGLDLYGERRIGELMRTLARSGDLVWLRFLYGHPYQFPLDLLDVLATEAAVCPYIDLPLQHINDRVLRAMGRGTSRAEIETLIGEIRRRVPGVVIRTTLMVGFPGETEEEFAELLNFAAETRFERLGAFIFSPEDGAPASGLPDRVAAEVGQERLDRLMSLQGALSLELNEALIGDEFEALVDGPSEDVPEQMLARTMGHAPEVDDGVLLPWSDGLRSGKFIKVKIVGAEAYSLVAERVE